ncbi:ZrgA family zinc uptake protein [Marinobacter sp. AL4B]|uniref:ZrgA family zinc uptake protein n=1 Tax=Marinobacter sp. AL4B TaxID=2871173 RepID=UPI001CAA720A|nr:DUF2796 domain-containing protein [Marinobacter sp. AL4B]MBZ0334917.1 DUF2796 domain-containing protein [Marinobacter sp. AL4B]
MKFKYPLTLTGALTLGLYAFPTVAQQNLQAHQHGMAELQVAVSGEQIDVLLLSPAYNLVGFEHPPRSAEQHQTVKSAVDWLKHTALVDTPHQQCSPEQSHVMTNWDDQHADHHDHSHRHDHDSSGHSDIEITQRLHCPGLSDINELQTELFDRFPGVEQINAQWVSPKGQNGTRLTPGKHQFRLGR